MTNQLIVTDPRQLESFQAGLVANAEFELTDAKAAFEDARKRGGGHVSALQRAAHRMLRCEMEVQALKDGFLPVPRMPIEAITDWRIGQLHMPKAAHERLADALAAGIFERVAIVVPQQRGRDPLIIGVIGSGDSQKHFLIAWWV